VEVPLYSVKADIKRAIIPQVIKLLVLGLVFYAALILNLWLLQIQTSLLLHLMIVVSLIVLLVLEVILIHTRFSRHSYNFYDDRITFRGKIAMFSDVDLVIVTKNFFDRKYKTSSIIVNKDFKIQHVKNAEEISKYLQQLVDRARRAVP